MVVAHSHVLILKCVSACARVCVCVPMRASMFLHILSVHVCLCASIYSFVFLSVRARVRACVRACAMACWRMHLPPGETIGGFPSRGDAPRRGRDQV